MDPGDSSVPLRQPTGTSSDDRQDRQQVMSPTLSVGVGRQEAQRPGHAVLAGEEHGPDYGGHRAQSSSQEQALMPNGVSSSGQQPLATGQTTRPVEAAGGYFSPMAGTSSGDGFLDAQATSLAQTGLGRATAPGATTHDTLSFGDAAYHASSGPSSGSARDGGDRDDFYSLVPGEEKRKIKATGGSSVGLLADGTSLLQTSYRSSAGASRCGQSTTTKGFIFTVREVFGAAAEYCRSSFDASWSTTGYESLDCEAKLVDSKAVRSTTTRWSVYQQLGAPRNGGGRDRGPNRLFKKKLRELMDQRWDVSAILDLKAGMIVGAQVIFLMEFKVILYLEKAKPEQQWIRDILAVRVAGQNRAEAEEESRRSLASRIEAELHLRMRQLQQAYLDKKDGPEQEAVKGGVELPKLPEPHADGGVEFQDWVYMTEQMVGSLTDKAGTWYMATLACAKEAFMKYQAATPLLRLNIAPVIPVELKAKLWERLDRRVLTLILAAMPRQAKEDAVTHRVKTTADALFRLYVLYQPGSSAERAAVLKLLEGTAAGENVEEVVTTLRRWKRHLTRATDMGITPPDASIQLKAIDLIIAKVIERDPGLSFRLSLARHTLQLQSRPTQDTVLQFYDHALAEIQQLAPWKSKTQGGQEATRLKALGATAGTGEPTTPSSTSSPKGAGKGNEKTPCKFFASDAGCKKGTSCKFAHTFMSREDKKSRCWTCGARNHRQSDCPVKAKARDPATPKAASVSTTVQPSSSTTTSSSVQLQAATASAAQPLVSASSAGAVTSSTASSQQPSGAHQHEQEVKALLQEANAMLSKLAKLQTLTIAQGTTHELRVAIKAYEAQVQARTALLDSGASHAFRPLREGEMETTTPIKVELAGGQETWLRQTKAGTLVPSSQDDGGQVGSIVPLGALVQQLNCTLAWTKDDGLIINHPSCGKITAQTVGNCPVIPEGQALRLIAELEEARVSELEGHVMDGQLRILNWDLNELRSWENAMAAYVATGKRHSGLEALMMPSSPFGQVDASIRSLMVDDVDLTDQAGWNYLKAMPLRRAMRKRLHQTSWIVHLYAGPYDKKSDNLKVTERNGVTVLELDILRSSLFSLRGQGPAYKLLLWAALRGQIVSVVGGPPRDSESTELICKQLFLWTLADKAMRMMRLPAPGFMMELPEGHGFWKSETWSKWSSGLRMPASYVSAGDDAGQYRVATNLDFHRALPVEKADPKTVPAWSPSSWTTTFKDQICDALQAWYKEPDLPRLARMLAKFEGNYDEMSLADLKKWALHVRNGHVPFHPRCQTCVSTRATGRRHQRVRSPSSYVLSLDISGPYRTKGETGTRKDFRYVLVGAFMIPKMYKDLKEGDSEAKNEGNVRNEPSGTSMKEDFECSEYEPSEPGSVLKEGIVADAEEKDELEGGVGSFGDYEDLFEDLKVNHDYVKDPLPEEELDKTNKEFWETYKEVGDPFQMQVLQYAIPLVTRRSSEVNAAIRTMILKIKAEGFPVVRCHSDRARELTSDSLRAWLVERDILPTTGEGQAPQQNGRAEAVVKSLKGRAKQLLHATALPRQLWPMAMTYAAFAQRETTLSRAKDLLPFGTPTHIRTKVYGTGGRHDLELRWAKGRYVGPAQDIPRGSVVRLDDGGYVTSVHLRPHLVDTDQLVDLVPHEVDLDFSESVRTRVKDKTTPTTRAAPRLPPGAFPTGRMSSLRMRPLAEEEEKAESLAKKLVEDKLYGVDNVLSLYERLEASRQKSSRGGSSMWFTGAFVRGGKAGLRLGTTRMPWSTRYLIGAARHLTGTADFTAVGVARNPKFGYHKDSHNEEEADNVVVGLNDVETGGGLWVQNEDLHHAEAEWRQVSKKVMCKGEVRVLGRGDVTRFAPRLWHGAEPHEGDRYIMILYTPRTRALLKEDRDVLRGLGFTSSALCEGEQCVPTTTSASTGQLESLAAEGGCDDEECKVRSVPTTTSASGQLESLAAEGGPIYLIDEHSVGGPLCLGDEHSAGGLKPVPVWAQDFSSEDEVQQPKARLLKSKQEVQFPDLEGPFRAVIEDQEGLIEELSERAATLRTLLEEEEILAEQVRRAGDCVQAEASHVRDLVEDMLDEVGKGLEHCQAQRELRCLKAIHAGEQASEEPDYEALLEGLQRDLEVVYTVPLNQVKPVVERWRDAISAEVAGLFEGTLRSITIEEARQLEKQGRLKLVPSKSVCTLKPPSEPGSKKRYRRKYRLVICGNYIDRPDGASGESLYAGGASAESLRASLALAVIYAWTAGSSDIARAFLLAEWPAHMPLYGVFPPRLLLQTGHAKPGEVWLIQRPLYGLREAPAIWAAFRTERLRAAQIDLEDGTWLVLVQSVVDPEVWLVKQRSANDDVGVLVGLLVTYVDDLLYLSKPWIVQKLHGWISSMWPTSALAWATDDEGLRYLGVEVRQLQDGTFKLGQAGYVKDVLRGHGMLDAKHTFLPAPKEWLDEAAAMERVPEEHSESQLKHAQRVVGELMWLTMRTRPDLLFVTSFMASYATRLPLMVGKIAARVHSYLAATKNVTLHVQNRDDKDFYFGPSFSSSGGSSTDSKQQQASAAQGSGLRLVGYSDASFSPAGGRSFGACLTLINGTPVAWKASKQAFVTLSVAEAEMYEAVQAATLLESVGVLLDEVAGSRVHRLLRIDNSAAVSLLGGAPGSWRTRHLRVRWNYLREKIEREELEIQHCAGSYQLADLATKVQTRVWTEDLMRLWGFDGYPAAPGRVECVKLALLLCILCSLPSAVAEGGEDQHKKDALPATEWSELAVFTTMVCIVAIVFWEILKLAARAVLRSLKSAKRERTRGRIRERAAEATEREFKRLEAEATTRTMPSSPPAQIVESPRTSTSRPVSATSRPSPVRPTATTTPPRRRSSAASDSLEQSERRRLVRDVLSLLLVDELQKALRLQGLMVSGVKEDLISRLGETLVHDFGELPSRLPTDRQLRYVLWIWRHHDLKGRVLLKWEDISSRRVTSAWIERWKDSDR
ncbi:Retrovirus-related Pol polyprotein from transposon TNT 1-94 [Symbiodinium microadriaticum]|uniref:Retrovirus-related Pol polyprotein from transposon TNT 1-94 n=1 Tax=Symbiodinium microadriaticum TaxID=2951 RepID=A0A1Q9ETF9_SYMMI|nr:Retrovirus-related Pol polyprotein from transposon TNT 1-94 [Symbiodinium microadriaticum]